MLIVTSDHGETFDTHSELWDHGATVYDETIHTPYIVRMPGAWRAGTRIPEQISAVDTVPTIVELLELPEEPVDGVSFLPELRGDLRTEERPAAYSEATKPHYKHDGLWQNSPMQKSVRLRGWKYMHYPRDEVEELYHPAEDPGELKDLLEQERGVVEALRPLMDVWVQGADPLESPRNSSSRVNAELKALGYLQDEPED